MSWDGLERYLPTKTEQGPYTGPFSTYAEYHAVGVGFLLGPQHAEAAVGYGAGSGVKGSYESAHLRDAAYELGYTGLGVFLRMVLALVIGVI